MAAPSQRTVLYKLRRLAGILFLFVAGICIALALAIAIYDAFVYYQAKDLLADIQRIEPGKTTVEEAINLARRRNGVANAAFSDGRAILDGSLSYQYVSFDRCRSGNCIISIPAPSAYHWTPLWLYYDHPKLFGWLPTTGIYTNRVIRRIIPLTVLAPPTITVRDGRVQEVTVTMAGSLVDRSTCPDVAIHHYGTRMTGTPWNVRPHTRFHTGGDCGPRAPEIRVDVQPDATEEQQRFSYSLNLRCQWPGTSCTECEMLPGICEDMDAGNWFYFTMPEGQVAKFRNAINNLRLGAEKGDFGDQVIFGDRPDSLSRLEMLAGVSPIEYHADWDPRKIWSDEDDEGESHKLTYYLKRWRAKIEEDSRDEPAVSLIFDRNERLVKIESYVDGIRSRP